MTAFCSNCGTALPPAARFCSVCGTVVAGVPPAGYAQGGYGAMPPGTMPAYYPVRLTRPIFGRRMAGVCAGIARSYGWDVGVVRIVTVVAGIFVFPIPEVIYLACWIGIPEEMMELPPPPPQQI